MRDGDLITTMGAFIHLLPYEITLQIALWKAFFKINIYLHAQDHKVLFTSMNLSYQKAIE